MILTYFFTFFSKHRTTWQKMLRKEKMAKLKCMLRKKVHIDLKLYICRTFCDFVNFNKNIKTYWHEMKNYNFS